MTVYIYIYIYIYTYKSWIIVAMVLCAKLRQVSKRKWHEVITCIINTNENSVNPHKVVRYTKIRYNMTYSKTTTPNTPSCVCYRLSPVNGTKDLYLWDNAVNFQAQTPRTLPGCGQGVRYTVGLVQANNETMCIFIWHFAYTVVDVCLLISTIKHAKYWYYIHYKTRIKWWNIHKDKNYLNGKNKVFIHIQCPYHKADEVCKYKTKAIICHMSIRMWLFSR